MSDDPLLGREVGSYRIVSVLGRGGMGTVYLAKHPKIGKKIAIKVLLREFSQEDSILRRFFHEAKAANDIRHQNVVDIIDIGKTSEGLYYLLMEYLEGMTLFDALRASGRFSKERVGLIGLQICSALAAAHQHGIIHRDLKADNVFLLSSWNQKDFVKILDFGIAKLAELEVGGRVLTREGFVLGTPTYMAPEQALGQKVDQQSDIYSLGVILYQMATCSLPFFDTNPVVVANMQVSAPLPSMRERAPEIDAELEAVIVKCLEKQKADRYTTMLHAALDLAMACKVNPMPHFDPAFQQQLQTLLEAKQAQEKKLAAEMSVQDTIQSVVFGGNKAVNQEITEESPVLVTTGNKRRPKHSLMGILLGVVGGLLVAALFYWGLSSIIFARPTAVVPIVEAKSQTNLPEKKPASTQITPPQTATMPIPIKAPAVNPKKKVPKKETPSP